MSVLKEFTVQKRQESFKNILVDGMTHILFFFIFLLSRLQDWASVSKYRPHLIFQVVQTSMR